MKLIKRDVLTGLSVILVALFMISASVNSVNAQSAALKQLKQKLRIGQVFTGKFEHIVIDAFTGERLVNEGEMWLTIKKYKVVTETQKLVVDGETSKVFDEIKNRVVISKYSLADDEFAPSRLLIDAEQEFNDVVEKPKGEYIFVSLVSDDPFATFVKVDITLNKEYLPIEIVAVEQTGNEIITRFSNPEFIEEQEEIFTLDFPGNAKVIDLRQ